MYKEIVISIIIVISIFILNNVTENYTKDSLEIMIKNFSEIKEELFKEEKSTEILSKKLENLMDDWNKRNEELAYYIEHDELEKVETEIALIEGQSESELYDEICPELEKCIFILEHIEDKTALNIKNIF